MHDFEEDPEALDPEESLTEEEIDDATTALLEIIGEMLRVASLIHAFRYGLPKPEVSDIDPVYYELVDRVFGNRVAANSTDLHQMFEAAVRWCAQQLDILPPDE